MELQTLTGVSLTGISLVIALACIILARVSLTAISSAIFYAVSGLTTIVAVSRKYWPTFSTVMGKSTRLPTCITDSMGLLFTYRFHLHLFFSLFLWSRHGRGKFDVSPKNLCIKPGFSNGDVYGCGECCRVFPENPLTSERISQPVYEHVD